MRGFSRCWVEQKEEEEDVRYKNSAERMGKTFLLLPSFERWRMNAFLFDSLFFFLDPRRPRKERGWSSLHRSPLYYQKEEGGGGDREGEREKGKRGLFMQMRAGESKTGARGGSSSGNEPSSFSSSGKGSEQKRERGGGGIGRAVAGWPPIPIVSTQHGNCSAVQTPLPLL